ncbi:hypothetical protein MXB_3437 [Myxobolus squamalis]|nr:hypothetical protein MXB_3437 [Myxobolus squamalis]
MSINLRARNILFLPKLLQVYGFFLQISGISSVCPKAVNQNDGRTCDIFGNICANGTCSGSPCLIINSKPCRCALDNSANDQCKLCCLNPKTNVCQPSQIFPSLIFHFQSPGSPCGSGNSYGICDDQGICIISMTDETQNNIIKLRNLEIIFRQYWLYVLLIAFGLTFIITGKYYEL